MRDRWQAFSALSDEEFETTTNVLTAGVVRMLVAKRQSYGPHNLAKFGDHGVLVRTSDKVERLIHMEGEGVTTTAVKESALDAWRDIAGYALLVLLAHSLEEA